MPEDVPRFPSLKSLPHAREVRPVSRRAYRRQTPLQHMSGLRRSPVSIFTARLRRVHHAAGRDATVKRRVPSAAIYEAHYAYDTINIFSWCTWMPAMRVATSSAHYRAAAAAPGALSSAAAFSRFPSFSLTLLRPLARQPRRRRDELIEIDIQKAMAAMTRSKSFSMMIHIIQRSAYTSATHAVSPRAHTRRHAPRISAVIDNITSVRYLCPMQILRRRWSADFLLRRTSQTGAARYNDAWSAAESSMMRQKMTWADAKGSTPPLLDFIDRFHWASARLPPPMGRASRCIALYFRLQPRFNADIRSTFTTQSLAIITAFARKAASMLFLDNTFHWQAFSAVPSS